MHGARDHAAGRNGFGRCPARIGVGHVQGAIRSSAESGGLLPAHVFRTIGPLDLPDAGPDPGRWLKPWRPSAPATERLSTV